MRRQKTDEEDEENHVDDDIESVKKIQIEFSHSLCTWLMSIVRT